MTSPITVAAVADGDESSPRISDVAAEWRPLVDGVTNEQCEAIGIVCMTNLAALRKKEMRSIILRLIGTLVHERKRP